jgi:hypothetical protein
MAAFDAAMALREKQLNEALETTYEYMQGAFPKVFAKTFTGSSRALPDEPSVDSISWKIEAPPRFDLSRKSVQGAATAIADDLWEQHGTGMENMTRDTMHELVNAGTPTFTVHFSVSVEIKYESRRKQPDVHYRANVVANCYLRVVDDRKPEAPPPKGSVEFLVRNVICPQTGHPHLENHVLPEVHQSLQRVLSGFTIPPFSFSDIKVMVPVVSIDEECIFVAVTMEGKPFPSPARMGSWVSPYFSLMMSQELVQKVVEKQYPTFSDQHGGGDFLAGYHWNYSLRLVPQVSLQGDRNIGASLPLTGTVNTSVYFAGLSVPHNCTVQVQPIPKATYILELHSSRGQDWLRIAEISMLPCDVVVNISSDIPWNDSFAAMKREITYSLHKRIQNLPRLSALLVSIPVFPAFPIFPPLLQSPDDQQFRLEPKRLQMVNKDGSIGIALEFAPNVIRKP